MVHKRGIFKSIVLLMLVFVTTIFVGCSDKSQDDMAVIGRENGPEFRNESVRSSLQSNDIGGVKSIKPGLLITSDIGGRSSSTIQFCVVSNVVDIGGRKGVSRGNVFATLNTEISGKNIQAIKNRPNSLTFAIGGKDRDIIRLTDDVMIYHIGGGGKGSTSIFLV